jgi:8-oxo-dGTP diphosphatase
VTVCPPRDPPPPILAVGAVIVGRDQRVILIRRGRPPAEGSWTLPGGRVEDGESLGAAIVREVREETNLETRVVCELGAVTIARERAMYVIHEHLVVPRDDRAPRAGDDAAEARWVSRAEVEALGVQPDAIAVIDQALREADARALWGAVPVRPGPP